MFINEVFGSFGVETLLIQIRGAKINYFNAYATGFRGGEVWETSVLGEFLC